MPIITMLCQRRRDVVDVYALKNKELCSDELRRQEWTPRRLSRRGPSQEVDGVDRLAIWNFKHVGMSCGTRRTEMIFARWRNTVFRGRRFEIYSSAILCDRDCTSSAKNDFHSLQMYFVAHPKERVCVARQKFIFHECILRPQSFNYSFSLLSYYFLILLVYIKFAVLTTWRY